MAYCPTWPSAPGLERATLSLTLASLGIDKNSDDESTLTRRLSSKWVRGSNGAPKTPSRCPTCEDSYDSVASNEADIGGCALQELVRRNYAHTSLHGNYNDDVGDDDEDFCFSDRSENAVRLDSIFDYFYSTPLVPGRFQQQVTIAPALHGDVRIVYDTVTKQEAVMKVLHRGAVLNQHPPTSLENPITEICVTNYLRSRRLRTPPLFLVNTHGTFADDKHFYLLQEPCKGGELYELLCQKKFISEARTKRIALQLVFALMTLHMNGLCHRDLSLENVLLMEDESVRLIDFGQAETLHDHQGKLSLLVGQAGKAYYRAPEMYIGPYFGAPVDVFALGVLIFLLITGVPPWREATRNDKRYEVVSSSAHGLTKAFTRWRWRRPSAALEDMLTSIFYRPAAVRPTLDDLLQHPWFAEDPAAWKDCRRIYPRSDLIREKMEECKKRSRHRHPRASPTSVNSGKAVSPSSTRMFLRSSHRCPGGCGSVRADRHQCVCRCAAVRYPSRQPNSSTVSAAERCKELMGSTTHSLPARKIR